MYLGNNALHPIAILDGETYSLHVIYCLSPSSYIFPTCAGILLEVEFVPCIILHDCRNLMKEVVGGILGTQDQIAIPPAQPNELYHPKDKIKLYHEHFTTFRKQVGTGTSADTNAKS